MRVTVGMMGESMADRHGIRLSVIIVSYGNERVVCDCLDSISKFNDVDGSLEVVVVEQTEDQPEIAKRLAVSYPWANVVRNPNRGFGAGNNRGVNESHGDLLLFLNPDTVLVEPLFSRTIGLFDAKAELGLFGVSLTTKEGKPNQSFYCVNGRSFWSQMKYQIAKRMDLFDSENMYITGADMFVRREAFELSGGFDERFFMYFEEPDLCQRIRSCGYSIEFHPEMRIVHLEGKSSGASDTQAVRMIESLELYCEKYDLGFTRELLRWRRAEKLVSLFKGRILHESSLAQAIGKRIKQLDQENAL